MQILPTSDFERFGTYAIRIDEFGRAADGEFQAVLTLKNITNKQTGLAAANITMTLTNSANDDRRVSVGNLYEAGVTGRFRDLKRIEHTIRLEPGEQTRVRLAWNNSAGFTPASVRLLEQAWDPGTAVYNVNGAALSLASTSGAASRPKPATPVPAAALATANSFTRPLASAGSGASIGAVPVT